MTTGCHRDSRQFNSGSHALPDAVSAGGQPPRQWRYRFMAQSRAALSTISQPCSAPRRSRTRGSRCMDFGG